MCKTKNADAGTPAPKTAGSTDCAYATCDGNGKVVTAITNAKAGATCGTDPGGVCDGLGNCGVYLSAPIGTDGKGAAPAKDDGLFCLPGEVPGATGIFVSASVGVDGASASMDSPVATLRGGIAAAQIAATTPGAFNGHIYVEEGTYDEQDPDGEGDDLPVVFAALSFDVFVEGAWTRGDDGSWKKDCGEGAYQRSRITATLSREGEERISTVIVVPSTFQLEFRELTIEGPQQNIAQSTSQQANNSLAVSIVAESPGDVSFVGVEVVALTGQKGLDDAAPFPAQSGLVPPCAAGTATAGANGGDGAAQSALGIFVNNQYQPSGGEDGEDGQHGDGSMPGAITMGLCFPNVVCQMTTKCTDTFDGSPAHLTSAPAIPGCGGGGATGGRKGGEGGAAIALYATGAVNLSARASRFVGGRGGDGGRGGLPGKNADGDLGTDGPPQTCLNGCSAASGSCVPTEMDVPGQSAGRGGPGGAGGTGGPGRGGLSIAVALTADAKTTYSASTKRIPGVAGHGAAPAADGQSIADYIFVVK